MTQVHFMFVRVKGAEQAEHPQRLPADRHQLLRLEKTQQQLEQSRKVLVRFNNAPDKIKTHTSKLTLSIITCQYY